MPGKTKKLRLIFIIYWILLAYILAALVWWFIALNRQNNQMSQYKIQELDQSDSRYSGELTRIQTEQKRKTAQYAGEGAIFFLLIAAGAVFIYRAVSNQLRQSRQQEHFMMALTHELKTPIAVAKLNLETMQKRKLDEVQQQRLLQTTLQETNRLNALCNNMLLSSQIEAGGYRLNMEETDFSELIRNCIADFIARFPQRPFNEQVSENIFVNGDRLLLQMAINNLIDNAIKYSPKESPITVVLQENNHAVQLLVKDEGKGVATTEKTAIFKKFYRIGNAATRAAKGTGLGLYLTRNIVQQHKGTIVVTDNQPTGAVFSIALPSLNEKNRNAS